MRCSFLLVLDKLADPSLVVGDPVRDARVCPAHEHRQPFVVAGEDLAVKGMAGTRLAKSVHDARGGWV
jgi:hypothetical protein